MTENLIVFLRKSVAGQVKSRLAVDLGSEEALSVYQWLLSRVARLLQKVQSNIILYYDQEKGTAEEDLRIYNAKIQSGKNLGDRMSDALLNEKGKKVLIGSDCPDLSESIIKEAFFSLSEYDLVIGPAEDGGFYLIGANKFEEDTFQKVDWGTDQVFDQVIKNAKALKLKTRILQTLRDVDRIEDLKHYSEEYNRFKIQHNVAKKAG